MMVTSPEGEKENEKKIAEIVCSLEDIFSGKADKDLQEILKNRDKKDVRSN